MFSEAHRSCDRKGCTNTIASRDASVPPTGLMGAQDWFQLQVMTRDGIRHYDFCSLEHIQEQLIEDKSFFQPVPHHVPHP